MVASLLSCLGAAASAGLNSTLALLILALADRLTGRIDLASPYSAISSTAGIIIILLVMPIELLADKMPGIDALSDRVHTVIRPLIGGFMGMAIASQAGGINVWIGGVLGFLAAGAVHLYKMRSRPVVTTATNGMANPFLSIAEDMATVVGTAVALFVPYAAVVVVPLLGWLLYRLTEKMKRGEFRIETLLGIKPPA